MDESIAHPVENDNSNFSLQRDIFLDFSLLMIFPLISLYEVQLYFFNGVVYNEARGKLDEFVSFKSSIDDQNLERMKNKMIGKNSPLRSVTGILGLIGVILICVIFMVGMYLLILLVTRWMELLKGKDVPASAKTLTPTQNFILAASSPTIGNQYKCVIDIWDTHKSVTEVERVKQLFEWGWGEFTYENVKAMVDSCLHQGYQQKYREYCSGTPFSSEYTAFQLQLLEEVRQKYPEQGMLGWDLVRVLSIVGGAYMGGIMQYEEAAKIALETCKILQNNFSSWDDMVGSYTLGYQFWRGEKKTDRLKYYQRIKKTWIYQIPWNTFLREEEL